MIEPVKVRLADGRERVLAYPLASCRRIDQAGGRERSVLLGGIWDEDFSLDGFVLLLWGGLIHAEPTLTIEEVEGLVLAHQVRELQEAIARAWKGLGLPPPREEDAVPPTAPTTKKKPRGRRSGRSGGSTSG